MEKRTIRVLVVDRAGADYRQVQKSLMQCGVLRYVVDRSASLHDAMDSVNEGRYDCCFVDSDLVNGAEFTMRSPHAHHNHRPLVFIANDGEPFVAPQWFAPLEGAQIARNCMTVPRILLAIRQALRANAAVSAAPTKGSRLSSLLSAALRPAYSA